MKIFIKHSLQFCKMHFAILLGATVLLNGCSTQTATERMSVTAKNTIEAARKSLKPECQTEETITLLNNAIATVDGMLVTCEQRVEVLDTKITNRNLLIAFEGMFLFLFVVAYLRQKL